MFNLAPKLKSLKHFFSLVNKIWDPTSNAETVYIDFLCGWNLNLYSFAQDKKCERVPLGCFGCISAGGVLGKRSVFNNNIRLWWTLCFIAAMWIQVRSKAYSFMEWGLLSLLPLIISLDVMLFFSIILIFLPDRNGNYEFPLEEKLWQCFLLIGMDFDSILYSSF